MYKGLKMYTLSHYQGHNEPLDTELLESYEGEARELILEAFIDNGMYSDTFYTLDDVEEEDIELEVKDYLTADEIATLKDIEKYASESLWDALTTKSLSEMMKAPTDEREVA